MTVYNLVNPPVLSPYRVTISSLIIVHIYHYPAGNTRSGDALDVRVLRLVRGGCGVRHRPHSSLVLVATYSNHSSR